MGPRRTSGGGPARSSGVTIADVDYIDRAETGVKGAVPFFGHRNAATCDIVANRRHSMSTRRILVAHRTAAIRDRFAVALADARHEFVSVDREAAAIEAVHSADLVIHLALVDLGLSKEGLEFVRTLKQAAPGPLPVVVFSGTVPSASDVPPLTALGVTFINEHASTPQILPALAPLLFPDNFNRRMNTRMELGVPVTYRTGETIAGAVTLDVGKGGLAIRTMNPLPKGTTVQVRFRLPGLGAEIDAAGRVAWSDRRVGMGVQFEKMSSTSQRSIDGFVDAHM